MTGQAEREVPIWGKALRARSIEGFFVPAWSQLLQDMAQLAALESRRLGMGQHRQPVMSQHQPAQRLRQGRPDHADKG
ncbi:hypothetical protein SDC9_199022 [bioreactor metagenome]|uniref:Uncharacterized protein n=1 Tax=bioreactor metagenome TaxID=1076179 RepID=A0A645IJB4_9ZZZZ